VISSVLATPRTHAAFCESHDCQLPRARRTGGRTTGVRRGFDGSAKAAARGEYSERTAQSIDEEVRRLLGEAEQRVRATLTERRAHLDELAAALLQHETVERSALLALLSRVQGAVQPPGVPTDAPQEDAASIAA
jgi:Peptidase family M41